jgi:Family of unknown function (DUF5681)
MADRDDSEPPYGVGYGKPPKQTQFAKGRSGNPKGRPKGSRNFATVIQAELKKQVTITEDGKRKKITKREAVAKQLVNKAASGDPRAIPTLLNETRPFEAAAANSSIHSDSTRAEDQMVMNSIVRRLLETNTPSSLGGASEPTTKSEGANANEGKSS